MRNVDLKDHTLSWMGRTGQFRSAMRGTFWPSEASVSWQVNENEKEVIGKCLRAVYYRLTGVQVTNPPTSKSQVIFLLGHKVEDAVVEVWKQSGIWDNNSVRFEDKSINLSGEFDCIVRNPNDLTRKFGVEVKSFWGYFQEKNIMGHYEGRGRTRRFVYGHPKDENLLQAAIYCDQTRGSLEGFKLFYVSRDNCGMCEFNITVDDEGNIFVHNPAEDVNTLEPRFKIRDIYSRYNLLAEHVDNNLPPVRDFKWKPTDEEVQVLHTKGKVSKSAFEAHQTGKKKCTDWHCEYCSYKDHCWTIQGNPRN